VKKKVIRYNCMAKLFLEGCIRRKGNIADVIVWKEANIVKKGERCESG